MNDVQGEKLKIVDIFYEKNDSLDEIVQLL